MIVVPIRRQEQTVLARVGRLAGCSDLVERDVGKRSHYCRNLKRVTGTIGAIVAYLDQVVLVDAEHLHLDLIANCEAELLDEGRVHDNLRGVRPVGDDAVEHLERGIERLPVNSEAVDPVFDLAVGGELHHRDVRARVGAHDAGHGANFVASQRRGIDADVVGNRGRGVAIDHRRRAPRAGYQREGDTANHPHEQHQNHEFTPAPPQLRARATNPTDPSTAPS